MMIYLLQVTSSKFIQSSTQASRLTSFDIMCPVVPVIRSLEIEGRYQCDPKCAGQVFRCGEVGVFCIPRGLFC